MAVKTKIINMERDQLWQSVLGEIELQISRPNFVTWLKNSRLVDRSEGTATVALPNTFTKEWVQNKYHKLILGSLRTKQDNIKALNFIVQASNLPIAQKVDEISQEAAITTNQLAFDELKVDPETNLNPKYTLTSFMVGRTNELAHAAAMGVIESIGKKYNPFFIYGGVGLGKTHLIQAMGNEIKKRYQDRVRVKYVTSEKFMNEVVAGIHHNRMEDLKERYRNVDVLIVDDIQFIAGKARTEEEFFHTFNALYDHNKQIILSSDKPPQYIPTLEARLRSRFQGGMIADITYPDYELRLAVLRTKIEEKGAALPELVVQTIAAKVQKNLRELEGILNRIIFYQQAKKEEITPKLVEKIIDETINQSNKNTSPEKIIQTVADYFQVPAEEITGKGRKQELIEPRQVAIYLLREILDLSYPAIGDKMGKRDHTTAIYAYNKIVKELQTNQELNQKVIILRDDVLK